MDSNSLYAAFGFIREHAKDVAQLFVLTHNLAFFRAVREWFHQLRKSGPLKKEVRFYMTCAFLKDGVRCSAISHCDPLLEAYDTDYHFLFKLVWKAANGLGPLGMCDLIGMPTIARRVLETFLAFRIPGSATLFQRLSATKLDEAKKGRIYRFIQYNSHRNSFGPIEEETSVLAETPQVMKAILELVEMEDKNHFDGMVACIQA
jgi:wobble nucleotide-excising tRNase